jgi:DNA-binding NtrC family response regulator
MTSRGTVLLVDDEEYVRDSLAAVLGHRGFEVRTAAGGTEADAGALAGVDALVTDLKMPGEDGMALLRRLAETAPGLPVVVLTGHGTVPSAVECMRAGAFDYLLKPAAPDELALTLDRAIEQAGLRRELAYLRSGVGAMATRREPLGVSAGWREAVRLAELAAPTDTSVLLLGESGTGKEEVAKLIHRKSARSGGALVRVNCAAIPTELFESEFFGHRRGAFTGATADREGRFRIAHGGTLFMDEIDALPPTAQAKVLRVLQDGVFERVGDSRPTRVDVRLVCATNADLAAAVDAGRFRPDLFYRINVLTIHLPPLRDRPEDVPVLARAFLEEIAARQGKPVRRLHSDTLAALTAYRWPGNVRELRNVVERAAALADPAALRGDALARLVEVRTAIGRTWHQRLPLEQAREQFDREYLRDLLAAAQGSIPHAAHAAGVHPKSLERLLRRYRIGRT